VDRTNRNEDKPSRIESQQKPPSVSPPPFRYKGQPLRAVSEIDKPRANGCVYFIRCGEYVKIGYSINPLQRLTDLQTGMPYRLEILASEWGTPEDEKFYHAKFKHLRHVGEWFHRTDELSAFIATLTQWAGLPKRIWVGPDNRINYSNL